MVIMYTNRMKMIRIKMSVHNYKYECVMVWISIV